MKSCHIGLDVFHKVPVAKCKGSLKDVRASYDYWAYWNKERGWESSPIAGINYIECIDQSGSRFTVTDETDSIYHLKGKDHEGNS